MWYKFSARHGPGHQGYTEYYEWFEYEPSPDERNEHWEHLFRETDWPIGKVRRVAKLPAKIREEKKEHFKIQIESAQKMLKILG